MYWCRHVGQITVYAPCYVFQTEQTADKLDSMYFKLNKQWINKITTRNVRGSPTNSERLLLLGCVDFVLCSAAFVLSVIFSFVAFAGSIQVLGSHSSIYLWITDKHMSISVRDIKRNCGKTVRLHISFMNPPHYIYQYYTPWMVRFLLAPLLLWGQYPIARQWIPWVVCTCPYNRTIPSCCESIHKSQIVRFRYVRWRKYH